MGRKSRKSGKKKAAVLETSDRLHEDKRVKREYVMEEIMGARRSSEDDEWQFQVKWVDKDDGWATSTWERDSDLPVKLVEAWFMMRLPGVLAHL
jgi:hypothetical protein